VQQHLLGWALLHHHAGVVVEEGPPEQVLLHPQHERTKLFLTRVKHEHEAEAAREEETARLLQELES
jgi:polar amino acid transport system ATP-binding protein